MRKGALKSQIWINIAVRGLLAVTACAAIAGACSNLNRAIDVKDDWAGEEIIESIIEQQTGMKIDLTPEMSPDSAQSGDNCH